MSIRKEYVSVHNTHFKFMENFGKGFNELLENLHSFRDEEDIANESSDNLFDITVEGHDGECTSVGHTPDRLKAFVVSELLTFAIHQLEEKDISEVKIAGGEKDLELYEGRTESGNNSVLI